MRLAGSVFRAHHPRWSHAPHSGQGAAVHGGRFNPRGVAALYTSLRMETAWLEAQQSFPFKAQPMTLCGYRVDCENMVDLTKEEICLSLGVKECDLDCPWEDMAARSLVPPSWLLAQRLTGSGVAGIIIRSFAHGATPADVNAIFWKWSDAPPHQVIVVDDFGRLPRNDASWRE